MRAVGPGSEPYTEWLRWMSSNPALFGTVELPQFFTVVHDLDKLLFAALPAHRLCPADDNYQWYARRAILAPLNETVKKINLKLLGECEGNVHKLYALDRADVNDQEDRVHNIPADVVRAQESGGVPPGELKVKLGCPLILLRKLNVQRRLCNGTRLTLTGIRRRVLQVRLPNISYELLPRINFTVEEQGVPWVLQRRQFLVKLVFALTINKSQGQSLDEVGVDLRRPVFTHGQLYVALSRATSVQGVKILMDSQGARRTENIVFPEVLLEPDEE